MAGEIQVDYPTGATLYAQVRTATGTIWNTVGVAFEAYLTANVADYDIALAEQGTASGYYAGNFPAAVSGVYNLVAKRRVGGVPAETDPTIAAGVVQWDGSAVLPLGAIPTVSQIWTTALIESYRASGAVGTPAQLLHELIAHLGDSAIAGVTKTINNRAGTAAKTYTLNSAVTPTAIAEA